MIDSIAARNSELFEWYTCGGCHDATHMFVETRTYLLQTEQTLLLLLELVLELRLLLRDDYVALARYEVLFARVLAGAPCATVLEIFQPFQ